MNVKYKELWLKALRSGEYKQGTGALCQIIDEDGKRLSSRRDREDGELFYCCLGVLNDVYNKEIGIYSIIEGGWLRDNIAQYLNLEWTQQTKLSSLNDKNKLSFEEIADYIEKNL